MSRQVRNRRDAYDNIAVGSAITARERVIAGSLAPARVYGGGTNVAVGSSWHTTDPGENIQPGVVTPTADNIDLSSDGTT